MMKINQIHHVSFLSERSYLQQLTQHGCIERQKLNSSILYQGMAYLPGCYAPGVKLHIDGYVLLTTVHANAVLTLCRRLQCELGFTVTTAAVIISLQFSGQ